jgi:hypothetical protein
VLAGADGKNQPMGQSIGSGWSLRAPLRFSKRVPIAPRCEPATLRIAHRFKELKAFAVRLRWLCHHSASTVMKLPSPTEYF